MPNPHIVFSNLQHALLYPLHTTLSPTEPSTSIQPMVEHSGFRNIAQRLHMAALIAHFRHTERNQDGAPSSTTGSSRVLWQILIAPFVATKIISRVILPKPLRRIVLYGGDTNRCDRKCVDNNPPNVYRKIAVSTLFGLWTCGVEVAIFVLAISKVNCDEKRIGNWKARKGSPKSWVPHSIHTYRSFLYFRPKYDSPLKVSEQIIPKTNDSPPYISVHRNYSRP